MKLYCLHHTYDLSIGHQDFNSFLFFFLPDITSEMYLILPLQLVVLDEMVCVH